MWQYSVVLTWLLAAESVHSLPKSLDATSSSSLRTQYPPAPTPEARLLEPETHGFYPTSLEREGRLSEQPFPTGFGLEHLLDPLLHPFEDSEDSVDLLDWVLSGLQPQASDIAIEAPGPSTASPPLTSPNSHGASTSSGSSTTGES
ncbi:uncharacterized protein ACLA_030290 [Aspergillus clavatus NRRL 1]|uniref:Uncharacterized protein n=1 Tax=Aspergillus clavatus (strain ATCC 1007 / CBS 513.65 / DSM 816 / NCTC 3887 / NRRL 1 / QM 1276 / 107) TaxID=344612 RepID=A1CRM5_ASPCL|nr:uncharacterized protein ACLA_030290 [Aspergillus clavatus NRRL 1]EAW08296.1 hypothetical protein ACLA_030290 [Aspergillus clavatus NRRL 1]